MKPLTIKIQPYIEAYYPIIYINSYEELKVDTVIKELAEKNGNMKIDEWSLTNREDVIEFLEPYVLGVEELRDVFIVLKDIHTFLDKSHHNNQKLISMLKKIVHKIMQDEDTFATIFLVSPILKIPIEIETFITVFEMDLPTHDDIKNIINKYANHYNDNISNEELEKFAISLRGLTESEVKILLNMAIQKSGRLISPINDKLILDEKRQIIKKSGILEMIDTSLTLDDIGGLENLKEWLNQKSKIVKNIKEAKAYGVDTPKGVFILGMSGCGKSLTAKATSILFDNIPLLRLDIGRLMGKYVGESEANMRKAIFQAESISPSILWIDEIEKAFSGIGVPTSGNEITTRLFGYFLTWMQEKTSEVYVIATANDVTNLPVEILRKGRFDEIFFVDFPNKAEREQIFKVHIKSRKKDIKNIDFAKLAENCEGFSGADIESCVKETIEDAFINDKSAIETEDYLKTIKNITSISEMFPDKIKEYKKFRDKMKIKPASKS